MRQVSFIVKDLAPSQQSYYLVQNLNGWLTNPNNDSILFYQNLVRPLVIPKCSALNCAEIIGYGKTLVATTLETALIMLNSATTTDRWFYVQDLEYLRDAHRNYEMAVKVYRSPRLKLITRSEDHRIALEKCFNCEVAGVVENYDFNKLMEILDKGDNEV